MRAFYASNRSWRDKPGRVEANRMANYWRLTRNQYGILETVA